MHSLISGNAVDLLENGQAFFPALENAIHQATVEIYLQTYIYETDTTGKRIGNALIQAAARGVEVYLLLDGYGCKDLPSSYRQQLEAAGIQVDIYRPKISPWTLKRQRLHRLHRKIAVIDGVVGFVGGINIIDDYNTPNHTPPRIDYAVMVKGPLVEDMRDSVIRLWWRTHHWFIRRHKLVANVSTRQIPPICGDMLAALLLRDNVKHRHDIEEAYLDAIQHARKEIIIANAYFLPGHRFRHALFDAAARGVQVKLLLQKRVEFVLLRHATHALYDAFIAHGVMIYEYHQSQMHSKVAAIDDDWAMVGSSNIDPISLLLSLEANVLVRHGGFNQQLKDSLLRSMAGGATLLDNQQWQRRAWGSRLLAWLVYGMVRLMISIVAYGKLH